MRSTLTGLLSSVLLGLACSCAGDELVGLHITLAEDGSGVLTTRALAELPDPTEVEKRTKGVDYKLRAAVVSSQGTFDDIGQVTLSDGEVEFAPQLNGDRTALRVTIARGPGTRWIEALVPDAAGRQRAAKAYDPSGRTSEIADVLRLEVVTPGAVVTSGVLPTGRGVQPDRDGKRAILLLPVKTALEEGDAFVWDVTWLKGRDRR
ncbi:MAG: hypothetical protein AB8H80_16470 [Planctomycetota bacterium]